MTEFVGGFIAGSVWQGVSANVDISNANDADMVELAFPYGEYFSREGGWLPAVARAIARSLSRVRRRLDGFKRQVDPRTADELLDEHESELGLAEDPSLGVAERRLRVLGKRRAQALGEDGSAVNKTYYEALAKSLGYADAVVTDAGDPFQCDDECDDALQGDGWLLTFIVTASSLGPELDAVLEEVIEGELLAGFYVVFELT